MGPTKRSWVRVVAKALMYTFTGPLEKDCLGRHRVLSDAMSRYDTAVQPLSAPESVRTNHARTSSTSAGSKSTEGSSDLRSRL